MKKLYRKERVHPSPTGGGGAADVMAVLKLLPAAALALTAAMGAEDREVLAYLIIRSMNGPEAAAEAGEEGRRCGVHRAALDCGCFGCYTSFWSRWDCSPNRDLIHQAIEGFEEHLADKERGGRGRRRDRSRSEKGKKKVKEVGRPDEEKEKATIVADAAAAGSSGGGAAAVEEEAVTDEESGPEAAAPETAALLSGERRRGWPDVIGLFNPRLWSLWGSVV